MRVMLKVSYVGTGFAGWQLQPRLRTVQGELESALHRLTGAAVRVTGSGRTDAGVHALGQVCHADIDGFDIRKLRGGLNYYLPPDIRVLSATRAADDFHARFAAKRKTYRYLICCGPVVNALYLDRVGQVRGSLDLAAMRAAALRLTGKRDFAAFMSSGGETTDTVRTVYELKVNKRGLIAVTVTADGFLYNMVRKIVSALISVGKGETSLERLDEVVATRDALAFGPATASGLYLVKVAYRP